VTAPEPPESHADEVDRAILQLARAIIKHPIAAQAAYQALVREGRAYAVTDDGRALRARLARSELVARLRTAWELATLGMLRDDAPAGAIPSVVIEAMVQAALRDRFEARLHDAMLREATER
jgi:nitroimidazol reductase NimA-like FMN-containing flavoprotein (pyridoxamine 5'-phosphate oxidase superfamily)